jgi:pimeloyl-ACP methyl ester carboxylesterase
VVALDCRGHGKSGKPHDAKQYGPEMGLDIVRLLDHLGIARAHVVGYSMGANIVAQLLTTHANRFLTATLGGSAGRFSWTAKDEDLFEQEAAETERLGFSPSLQLRTAPPNTPKLTDEEITRRSAVALADTSKDRHAVAALIRSFRDQVITVAQAGVVSVPTMGIAGSADPQRSDIEDLKKLRPALRLVVVDGATHYGDRGVRSRPEFVSAIRDFISSHSQIPR